MTSSDMHLYFRQYAQRMGMQNVRYIEPEQIDLLLNAQVSEEINQLVREQSNATEDVIVFDDYKISRINALRQLYKSEALRQSDGDRANNKRIYPIPENCRLVLAINVAYKHHENEQFNTRIIEPSMLSKFIRDAISRPTFVNPVATITNNSICIYGIGDKDTAKGFPEINYIKNPDVIKYSTEDTEANNIEYTSLPSYLHETIVKKAVEDYIKAITPSNTYANPYAYPPYQLINNNKSIK